MEIDDNEYDLSVNNRRAWWFAIVGMLILIFNILTEHISSIFSNFISVVWWVAIWDMVEILILGNTTICVSNIKKNTPASAAVINRDNLIPVVNRVAFVSPITAISILHFFLFLQIKIGQL